MNVSESLRQYIRVWRKLKLLPLVNKWPLETLGAWPCHACMQPMILGLVLEWIGQIYLQ